MKEKLIEVQWPNGKSSLVLPGADWFQIALEAGISIPAGCLGGSCGACEVEINGKIIRPCVTNVPCEESGKIQFEFAIDPYWEN